MVKRDFYCEVCKGLIDPKDPGDGFGFEWHGKDASEVRELPIVNAENHMCGPCHKAFKAFTPAPF